MRLILAGLITAAALAQVSTSRLEGTVEDPSGAVVPGASVTTVNQRTGTRAIFISDPHGFYVFPSLVPGEYTLTVEAQGFRTSVLSRVALTVGTTLKAPVSLELGATAETVTIEAKETAVQTSNAQGGRAVVLREIDVLPQLQRNPVALAVFQPGVQIAGGGLGFSRINGARLGSNVVKLDGVDTRDPLNPGLAYSGVATSDFVQEFRVVTHSAPAEYGRSSGGQIEMVTRSGTNRWSGALFEFHRNTALNANDFFNNSSGQGRPELKMNVFGGSLGGPLRRERTFVFVSYQGSRTRQDVVRNRLVLTPEAKSGVFRWRTPGTANVQAFDIARNDPRGRGIDPAIAENLRLIPAPNNFDAGDGLNSGGFRFNNPADVTANTYLIRLDHNLTSAAKLYLRYTPFFSRILDVTGDAPFPGQASGTIEPRAIAPFSLGSTWAVTPRTINDLRIARQDLQLLFTRPARLPAPMLVTSAWTPPLNPLFPREDNTSITELTDHLSMARGKHTLKVGINLRFLDMQRATSAGIYPNVILGAGGINPPATFGPPVGTAIAGADRQRFDELYNHLLGHISAVQQTFYSDLEKFQPAGARRIHNYRNREYHGFFQDDWKLRRNLTLNLGLRYEFNGRPFERDRQQGAVNRAGDISQSSRIADLTLVRTSRWYNNDWNNFAPRFGLVWDPAGDGKTALRASFGIYYDAFATGAVAFVDANTPGFSQVVQVRPNTALGSDLRLSDGIPALVAGGAPVLRVPLTREMNMAVFSPAVRNGYSHQYSFSLQREIARNTVIEAAFVGNRGVKLFMHLNQNQRRIEGDFLQAFSELQAFRSLGVPVPPGNTLVRLFGSPNAAVNGIGAALLDRGEAGAAADRVDRDNFGRYPAAGISDFYIRNFPQYNLLIQGVSDGRSYYDSLQLSLRRQTGALKFDVNYTWSKTIDTISAEGEFFDVPIDNFNLRLNRARSNGDRPHVFTGSGVYTLPIGRGHRFGGSWPRWLANVAGGWDLGALAIWESGGVFSVRSGRQTAGTSAATFADFTGDRNMGRVDKRGDGVFWFSPEELQRFSFPTAGEIGTSGRNAFRGPRFCDVDLTLVKRFAVTERHSVVLRGEAYNLFNSVNFANPGFSLVTPASLGRVSSTVRGITGAPLGEPTGGPRVVQLALRWEF